MKSLYLYCCFSLFAILAIHTQTFAQAVADPASIDVYKAVGTINLDGQLLESDWALAGTKPHLMFKQGGTPSGFKNTPTGGAVVKPPYNDVSTCYVKFLHIGTNLYLSLDSDDHQVCRFGDSWEGDGIFMKINNSTGTAVEFKLYYNLAGVNPAIHYEGPAYGSGAGYKKPGTIVNDSTNVDAGYSAELRIDLTGLGFTSATQSLQVLINIFDPDNYNDGVPAWGNNGNFYKQWWGSEWGPESRILALKDIFVPVELTSFTAEYLFNTTVLNWTTGSEINNFGFEVQRNTSESEFETIAFVKGSGTSTEAQRYSYTDNNTSVNTDYSYRLKQVDFDGNYAYSNVIKLGKAVSMNFELKQNYPNPFNPATTISIGLPLKSDISLDVYNITGEKVLSLFNGVLNSGSYDYQINASNFSSGTYIYVLIAAAEDGTITTLSRKMTLLK